MQIASRILATIVALEHIFFLVLEMFLWQSLGVRLFKLDPDFAAESARLAMNQGLYNGFLAAGIIWAAYFIKDRTFRFQALVFFLSCVLVAGIFGGLTVKMTIMFTQGLPALLALIFTFLARNKT